MGLLHGLFPGISNNILVNDINNSGQKYAAVIESIGLDYSVIKFEADFPPKEMNLEAEITQNQLIWKPVKIGFDGHESEKYALIEILENMTEERNFPIFYNTPDESQAEYVVRLVRNYQGRGINIITLTYPFQQEPLATPIQYSNDEKHKLEKKSSLVFEDIYHIFRWKSIKYVLQNLQTKSKEEIPESVFPLSITLIEKDGEFQTNHTLISPKVKRDRYFVQHSKGFSIEFENNSSSEWYCALVIQTPAFGILTDFFPKTNIWLAPKERISTYSLDTHIFPSKTIPVQTTILCYNYCK